MFGEAGSELVAALAASTAAKLSEGDAADLHAAADRHIQRYLSYAHIATSTACTEDEFLYGRAGYLFGCLLLRDQFLGSGVSGGASSDNDVRSSIFDPVIEAVTRAIILSGLRQTSSSAGATPDMPLWWEWHGAPYLGAAHGAMGILYVLLHVPHSILTSIDPNCLSMLQSAVDYVATLECDAWGVRGQSGDFPARMGAWRDKEPLLHWCHGAIGAVFLFTQASNVFGNGKGITYLEVAARCGEAVWRRGLLRKGPGLCHGVSGSAYALLRLYKSTGGDEKWLFRANQMAEFMGSSEEFLKEARVPDHPASLYEGWAGAACLYADLMEPDYAAFPLFELGRGARVKSE